MLKTAIVTPVYKKKGIKSSISSYRPISVLCSTTKVFESLVANSLTDFLNDINFFARQQHGFRRNHSTLTAITSLTNIIYEAAEQREYTAAVYLDFTHAYDVVNPVQKVQLSGVGGPLLLWFQSFLNERTIQVRYGSALSDPQQLTASVPQGSSLGCLLFSIFINCNIIMYADDGTATGSTKEELEQQINEDMQQLHEYCKTNHSTINEQKTKLQVFHSPKLPKISLHIECNSSKL